MIVIACLDDNGGMMFNHRRQSQDRVLRAHIAALVGDARLWMNHYPTCSSVNDMKEKNKQEFFGTRDETIALGYSPCGRCKP